MYAYLEFSWYFLLMLMAFFFTIKRKVIVSSNLFLFFYLFLSLVTSVIIRTAGFDWDIQVYANAMHSKTISTYYLKEPIVWFGMRYLYTIVNSEILVFVIYDVTFYFLFFCSIRQLKYPQYSYFLVFLFFPFFLGAQNVYRQFAAEIFLIASIAYSFEKKIKSSILAWVFLLFSFLSHNAVMLFLSAFFITKKKFRYKFLSLVYLLLALFATSYLADIKSADSQSALSLELVYAALSVIIPILYVAVFKFKFKNDEFSLNFFVILLMNTFIVLNANLFLSSTQSERVGMFSFSICLIALIYLIEKKMRHKPVLRFLLVVFSSLPVFVFSSSRSFLFGS